MEKASNNIFRGFVEWSYSENGKVQAKEEGFNTITAGANYNVMSMTFGGPGIIGGGAGSGSFNDGAGTLSYAYNDGFGYFPNMYDLTSGNIYNASTTVPYVQFPFRNLFGQIWALSGGSGGISGNTSHLASVKPGFVIYYGTNNAGWGVNAGPWASSSWTTISSRTLTIANNNAQPKFGYQFLITNYSSGYSYTIDSIAWVPSYGWAGNYSYGWFQMASGAAPASFAQTMPQTLSYNGSGITAYTNVAISALYVLPYTVTINPGGQFQFTYNFLA